MNIFVLIGMIGLFAVTAVSLFRLLEYKKLNDMNLTFNSWKYSFLIIALGFLFFFMYFNSTMQGLQAEETITVYDETITIQNNDYVEYFSYMPYMSGMLVMMFAFNAGVYFLNFGIFSRKRMGRLKSSI